MKGRLKRIVAIFMLILQTISLADGIVPDGAANKNLQVDNHQLAGFYFLQY